MSSSYDDAEGEAVGMVSGRQAAEQGGYRLLGPKLGGGVYGEQLKTKVVLGRRARDEIRRYLDAADGAECP